MTIVSLLQGRALACPQRIACGSPDGQTLTYIDWHERSAVAAGHLAGMIERGDRVALLFSLADWIDYAVAYMSVAKAGGVCVPVAEGCSLNELYDILLQVHARLLITSYPVDAGACRQVTVSELARVGPTFARRPPSSSEPAEILFTSGTTGSPKPVTATHANLAHHISARRGSQTTPAIICHATAFASNAAQTMLIEPLGPSGSTVITAQILDARTLDAVTKRFGVSEIIASPATLITLAASDEHDFSSIRRVNAVAAPVTPAHLRRIAESFRNATIVNIYTSTEAWPARTTLHLGDGPVDSVGRPRGGSDVVIVGPDDIPAGPGEIGDIALSLPPNVPPRSHFGARATVGSLVKTGDVGFLDDGGYLYIVDRETDVINVGGAKIYSLEVEAALAELPAVSDVAVVGISHETLGEYAVAVVTLNEPASVVELRRKIRARLGTRKMPHEIVVLSVLPRNASGKVDKQTLRERLVQRTEAASPNWSEVDADLLAPSGVDTDLLARVTRAWEQALDVNDLDGNDNFFASGGNSLLAMQIVVGLSEELGVDLPTNVFFEWTTITEMTEVIQACLQPEGIVDDG